MSNAKKEDGVSRSVNKATIDEKIESLQSDLQATIEQHEKATTSVNNLQKLFDRQQGALIGLQQLKEELFGPEKDTVEK